MRKNYGNTWWGKQFLNALRHIDFSNRLPRGKTYANKGAVREIEIKDNSIRASVQGTRRTPYRVTYTIPPFEEWTSREIIELITSNPMFLSRLLNRDLPPDLHTECGEKGIEIFPQSWRDFAGECSCPDWAVPCKHMAAVLYLVANEIDKNPFLVFELRGLDLFQRLHEAGYTAGGQKGITVPDWEEIYHPLKDPKPDRPWQEDAFEKLDFSVIPDCKETLTSILQEQPVFYPSGDFRSLLDKMYRHVAKKVAKIGQEPAEDFNSSIWLTVEKIEIIMNGAEKFSALNLLDRKGKRLSRYQSLEKLFAQIPDLSSVWPDLAPPVRFLYVMYRFTNKLVQQGAYVPELIRIQGEYFKIRWKPAILNEKIQSITEQIEALYPGNMVYAIREKKAFVPGREYAVSAIGNLFLQHWINVHHPYGEFRYQQARVIRLFFNGSAEVFDEFETREYPGIVHLWLSRFSIAIKEFVPVVQVSEHTIGFQVDLAIEPQKSKLEAPIPLKELFTSEKFRSTRLDILRNLTMLVEFFPQLNRQISSQGKEHSFFDAQQFVEVLFKTLPLIRLFGIRVLLPKSMKKILQPQLSMEIGASDKGIVKASGLINLQNMLRFNWRIAIGNEVFSAEEFAEKIRHFAGIVKLNDQYVHLDEKQIHSLLQKLDNPPKLTGPQILQIALTEQYAGAAVQIDDQTRKMIDRLLKGKKVRPPKSLRADLRPYQLRGFSWLYQNSRIGFGSLIADDMGLGKTIQVIATLLKLKEEKELEKAKGLIIVPTTLLTNWQKEIDRFAPTLTVHVYHGPGRELDPLQDADLLLTTYGVLRNEVTKIKRHRWLAVVIDEAQNIKNPATAQTKAIKKIDAPIKIAMSGTPVENRLAEYWSIFDYTNRGYLGRLNGFKKEFAKPIEIDRNKDKLEQFRKMTHPFILRRLKSDKSIIKDLPEKIEQNQYCSLTQEQAAIYQNVVDNNLRIIEEAEGIERRGLVLKLITALKQICNHPRHFLKKGPKAPDISGKSTLFVHLLHQVLNAREKALIFTQYREMGEILVSMIEQQLGLETNFLHGGVSRKDRDEMVEDFQNNRSRKLLLLSLKAGGTGLNLTAASNVIHYDLWWNPAVETQATDRAYRIGQEKNVLVHRLITRGTFEEKIDELLQQKKELANLTVATGEKWIGELSNEELNQLIKLEHELV